ncbi:Cyclin-L1, partial [Kappamyces sp. JEL0680]
AYFVYREGILQAEIRILASLGFNVHVEHPHGFLLHYLSSLDLAGDKALCQLALNYLHDRYGHRRQITGSYRTIVFCLFQPQTIAAAVVFLACKKSNIGLVEDPPWYTVFDANLEDLELISLLICELYRIKKALTFIPLNVSEFKIKGV